VVAIDNGPVNWSNVWWPWIIGQ